MKWTLEDDLLTESWSGLLDLCTKSNITYYLMLGCSSYYGLVVMLNGSNYLHCSHVRLDLYATGF